MYSTTTASLVSMPIINFSAHFVLEFGGFSGVRRFSVDLRRRKYRFELVSRDKMTRPLYPPGLQLLLRVCLFHLLCGGFTALVPLCLLRWVEIGIRILHGDSVALLSFLLVRRVCRRFSENEFYLLIVD